MSIFTRSADLLAALNHHDPAVRLERCEALGQLVEDFEIQMIFHGDRFVGIVDRLPSPRVTAAIA